MSTPYSFEKYSSNGNHFVLFDEAALPGLDDVRRAALAAHAGDPACGVGADSVIFLSREGHAGAAWRARFFDPTGKEFLTCGNGLACIARHLRQRYGVDGAPVLVELPSDAPRWSRVRWDSGSGTATVQLELQARARGFVSSPAALFPFGDLLLFSGWTVASTDPPLVVSGALAYTGEPHLVVFQRAAGDAPPAWPAELPWVMDATDLLADGTGARHVDRIGRHANQALRALFPDGVNVVLARLREPGGAIEYRCFERGIERETLACGTGALAAALVARRLRIVEHDALQVLPLAARAHRRYRDAQLLSRLEGDAMTLTTTAEHVFTGQLTSHRSDAADDPLHLCH